MICQMNVDLPGPSANYVYHFLFNEGNKFGQMCLCITLLA